MEVSIRGAGANLLWAPRETTVYLREYLRKLPHPPAPFISLAKWQSMSDSLQPQELCSPWSSPGQNTGVGSLSLLEGIFQFSSWVGKICWRRDRLPTPVVLGFPCGSAAKESTCNAQDLGLIPGLGRSPGEGKGYPSSILAWRIPWTG